MDEDAIFADALRLSEEGINAQAEELERIEKYGERRSPSKSRERRLAEVMHIAALRLEIKVHSEFLHDTELLREDLQDIAEVLHSAIQELRK